MRFAIFTVRDNPDSAIFDVDVGTPPIGKRDDYDCAGVFEVEHADVSFRKDERGSMMLLYIEGSGDLGPGTILLGDFRDQHSGNPAPITTLWRPNS